VPCQPIVTRHARSQRQHVTPHLPPITYHSPPHTHPPPSPPQACCSSLLRAESREPAAGGGCSVTCHTSHVTRHTSQVAAACSRWRRLALPMSSMTQVQSRARATAVVVVLLCYCRLACCCCACMVVTALPPHSVFPSYTRTPPLPPPFSTCRTQPFALQVCDM
jgi:hypothetical protein